MSKGDGRNPVCVRGWRFPPPRWFAGGDKRPARPFGTAALQGRKGVATFEFQVTQIIEPATIRRDKPHTPFAVFRVLRRAAPL